MQKDQKVLKSSLSQVTTFQLCSEQLSAQSHYVLAWDLSAATERIGYHRLSDLTVGISLHQWRSGLLYLFCLFFIPDLRACRRDLRPPWFQFSTAKFKSQSACRIMLLRIMACALSRPSLKLQGSTNASIRSRASLRLRRTESLGSDWTNKAFNETQWDIGHLATSGRHWQTISLLALV